MLPNGLAASLDAASWPRPPIFDLLAAYDLTPGELYRTFNMGIGMVLACAPDRAAEVLAELSGAYRLGAVVEQGADARVLGL